jgi:hypothetical protein
MLKHPLTRDVAAVTAAKLIVAVAAAVFVFGAGQRPKIDANAVAMQLIGSPDVLSQTRTHTR